MSEIPKDIGMAATYVLDGIHRSDSQYEWHSIIAHAILAERQRCADVVAHYCDSDEYSTNYRLMAADMAEAIRRQQP